MIPDLILISCVLLVAVGAGLIYPPAGLIVGGVLGFAGTLAYVRGDLDREAGA